MPTPSARLALLKPSTSDPFVTADLAGNLQKIDDTPGYRPCTSSTRPSWTAAQTGMLIVETDTGLIWRWNGTTYNRIGPAGVLKTTGGAMAIATRTTDFSTTSTTPVICLSLTSVVVPDGSRPIALVLTANQAENSNGALLGAVWRGNVANSGTTLGQFSMVGDSTSPTAGAQGGQVCFVAWEITGLSAGTYSWSFQIKSSTFWGGTSSIRAAVASPAKLVAVEL